MGEAIGELTAMVMDGTRKRAQTLVLILILLLIEGPSYLPRAHSQGPGGGHWRTLYNLFGDIVAELELWYLWNKSREGDAAWGVPFLPFRK